MHKCYSNRAYMHGYCSSYIFFLSPSPHSLIFNFSLSPLSLLSLVPQFDLTDTINLASLTSISPVSSISLINQSSVANQPHWSASPISLADQPQWLASPISLASLIRSHSPLILFNFLFYQFWIFYLISGFWGDGGWWCWVDNGG